MDTTNEAESTPLPSEENEKKRPDLPAPEKDDLRPGTLVFDVFICFISAK